MTVLQTVFLEALVVMEPEEAARFEESRVLPSSVFEAGISVKPNGHHYVPAEQSWTGDDINFSLDDEIILTAKWLEETSESEAEEEEETEEPVVSGDESYDD